LTALEEKDRYTAGHSRRVTHYAVGIARLLGVNDHDQWVLQTASQLHDMGKLMIDLSYVNKPGPLSPEEWEIMKEHPAMADRFLSPLPFLEEVRPIIRSHHERMDGSGYPDALEGDEVTLLTQILAVADSYDAMTSRRSYRDPMPIADAIMELRRFTGVQFRPEPVDALVEFLANGGGDIKSHLDPGKPGLLISVPWMGVR
jgi:HD-GYP domain-containing protein (c-di-GMP phosphodiesterase class II)